MVYNPEVRISINESISLTQGGKETIIMIMGTAQWGPEDTVQSFSNFGNILDTYKEDVDTHSTIIKAADLAYANGAKSVKVVRVTDSGAAKATLDIDGAGPTVGVLTFNGKYKGVYGNNFTVDTDTQGTGRLVTITNGDYVEVFDNNGDANGYTTNAAIAAAINATTNGSILVDVVVKAGSETSNLVNVLGAAQSLASGDDGSNGLVAGDYTTLFDSVLITEDWDLLVIGDSDNTNLENGDTFQTSILGKLNTRASTHKKYSMFITGVIEDEAIATIQARTTKNSRVVLCAPSIAVTSRIDGSDAVLDGTYLGAAIAGLIAGQDIEVAITRKVLTINDLQVLASSGKKYYNNTEIEQLLSAGVCCVSKIGGALKVARGVTRVSDTTEIYYEINIRRIVDDIRTRCQILLDGFLGDPNISRVRKTITAEVDGLLNQAVADEEIVAYQTTQVTEGDDPDTINVALTIQPTFAINFINVVISVSRI